jgi:hypothetical protein
MALKHENDKYSVQTCQTKEILHAEHITRASKKTGSPSETSTRGIFRIPDEHRENLDWGLVEADSPADAEEQAWKGHCPEAFAHDADRKGAWVRFQGHRAFQFNDDHPLADQNCVFWVESVVEVLEAEAPILRKYLPSANCN